VSTFSSKDFNRNNGNSLDRIHHLNGFPTGPRKYRPSSLEEDDIEVVGPGDMVPHLRTGDVFVLILEP